MSIMVEVEGKDPNIGGFGFQGGASFVDHLCYFCRVLICLCARLFINALRSTSGKGLTS